MMKSNLISQLQQLRHGEVSPRPEWVAKNRAVLLSQIKNTLPHEAEVSVPLSEQVWSAMALFLPRQLVYSVVRPVVVVLMVSLLGTGGFVATSSASNEALPGDRLYPVKIALEKTKVALVETVGNENVRTQAHIEYASNRVTEIKRITAGSADPNKNFHIAEAVSNLKEGVERVNNSLNQNLSGEVIKDVKANTDEVKSALKQVSSNLETVSTTSVDTADLNKELVATTNLAKDTAVKAIEVFVQKVDDKSVSAEAAKDVLADALTTITSDVDSSKQNIALVKNIAQAAEAGVKDLQTEIKKQNLTTVIQTDQISQELSKELSNVATQATAAATSIELKSAEVGKKISEVQALVQTDQLQAAVDKLKEVNNDTKNISATADSAIKKANDLLPVTPVIKEAVGNTASTTDVHVVLTTTTSVLPKMPDVPVITVVVSGTVSATKVLVVPSSTPPTTTLLKN